MSIIFSILIQLHLLKSYSYTCTYNIEKDTNLKLSQHYGVNFISLLKYYIYPNVETIKCWKKTDPVVANFKKIYILLNWQRRAPNFEGCFLLYWQSISNPHSITLLLLSSAQKHDTNVIVSSCVYDTGCGRTVSCFRFWREEEISFTKMLEVIHGPSCFEQIFHHTIYFIWGAAITAEEKAWVWGFLGGFGFWGLLGLFFFVFCCSVCRFNVTVQLSCPFQTSLYSDILCRYEIIKSRIYFECLSSQVTSVEHYFPHRFSGWPAIELVVWKLTYIRWGNINPVKFTGGRNLVKLDTPFLP